MRAAAAARAAAATASKLCMLAAHTLGMALQTARPPIRAIITDIDGTLFPFGTSPTLSQRNADALNAALDAGVHVSLATGRIPGPWCDKISGPVPRVGASVFSNGALVLDAEGEVLSERHLLPETVAAVVEHTLGGRAAGGGRLAVLACARWEAAGPAFGSLRYLELSPDGEESWIDSHRQYTVHLCLGVRDPASR